MLAAVVGSCGGATARWQEFLEQNPFVPYESPASAASAKPPPYELRGVSVERGIQHYSLYNLETKKAVWLSAAESRAGLRVKGYEAGQLTVMDASGAEFRLERKGGGAMDRGRDVGPAAAASGAVAALAMVPTSRPVLAEAAPAPIPEAEIRRLEPVTEQIRLRRAQRKAAAGS